MKTKQDTQFTRPGTAHRLNSTGKIFGQFMKIPGAVGHLMAGPPMSERDRFKQNVAEARARGGWLRPR